jgi:cation diffusion facilitator family transporter
MEDSPTVNSIDKDFRRNFYTLLIGLGTSCVLMALKFLAYWITGSSAILSDALESIINIVAGGFALGSLMVSVKPPDESHPYGHGKIEYFSAGFEGALIIVAAIGILIEGAEQIWNPRPLPRLDQGLLILLVTVFANLAVGVSLIRTGARTGSLILTADGKHILTDVYTSLLVFVGVGLVHFTGWYRLDGVVACVAGVNIVVSGAKLVRQAFVRLMDASDPKLLEEICSILSEYRREIWIDVHRLRAWRSGQTIHVDFHLILPRDLPLEKGHGEVKYLEGVFNEHFKGLADVLIHLDPCDDPECPVCNFDPCDLRQEKKALDRPWRRDVVINDSRKPE